MNFIFFGRLTQEKGFDLIVHALVNIIDTTGKLPGNIYIFGEGNLRDLLFQYFGQSPLFEDCSGLGKEDMSEKIEMLSSNEPSDERKIYFFGWQPQSLIGDILKISHFSLMPSRFLETFGLSALESLAEGVPVIGFRKGGLTPFILEELSLYFSHSDQENRESLSQKMQEVAEKYFPGNAFQEEMLLSDKEDPWSPLSHQVRCIADGYTEGRWMRQIQEIFPKNTRKILLVSDYIAPLGGIEIHLQSITRVLRNNGYEVEISGWDIEKSPKTKLLRYMGLMYSLCNTTSAKKIHKKMEEFTPDIVWIHSVSRFLGPLVIQKIVHWGQDKKYPDKEIIGKIRNWAQNKKNFSYPGFSENPIQGEDSLNENPVSSNAPDIATLITYHDLGLFAPFPSKVESEDMMPKTSRLGSFLEIIHSRNPIVFLAAYCKYFQVSLIRRALQGIDIHIIPSKFLVRYIRDIGEIPEEKIVVLEHFL